MGLASGHPVRAGSLPAKPVAPKAPPAALDVINALSRLEAHLDAELEAWRTTAGIRSEEHRQRKVAQLSALRADLGKVRAALQR